MGNFAKGKNKSVKEKVSYLKNHPFVVPVITFLTLFFVTMILYIMFGGGTTIGPSDSKIVSIYVDGTKQTLPTRIKVVSDLLDSVNIKINKGDVVEPSLDSTIIDDNFSINIYRARPILLIDKGKKIVTNTSSQSAKIAARNAGIIIYPEDEIIPEAPENIFTENMIGERYRIDRATPLTLILYGNISGVRTQATTVEEFIKETNIQTSDSDTIKPALNSKLTNNMKITITRQGQQITTKEEKIPAPIDYVDDASILVGEEVVKEEGIPGKKVVTYEVIKNSAGKVTKRKKLQEIITIKPSKKIVARGTKIIISNPSQNVKIGEKLASERGWTGQQFYCLYQLWQHESGWNTTSGNPTTGAYGIPQALPGSKMSSAGSDWRTNPETQIRWGMGYIAGRYSSPCSAYSSSQSQGWY
jgi:uncharacterized protein YabE (DUF348 family)